MYFNSFFNLGLKRRSAFLFKCFSIEIYIHMHQDTSFVLGLIYMLLWMQNIRVHICRYLCLSMEVIFNITSMVTEVLCVYRELRTLVLSKIMQGRF